MARKKHSLNRKESILLYSNNLWLLGEGMLGPLYAVFANEIGGSILDISWAWAVYLIVAGIMTIAIGWLADKRIDKEKTMIAGFMLNALATYAYLLVSHPSHLFIVQGFLGLALALATPTWYALYAKHENRRHDTIAWGIARGDALLLTGIAMLAGGYVVTRYGFDTLFIAMGTVQLCATLLAVRILR